MPSYNLLVKNNLGDVRDIIQARLNLFDGNISGLKNIFSNNVSITDGNISIDNLALKKRDQSTLPYISIIESKDDHGNMIWSTNREYNNLWIYNDQVYLSGFNQDVSFIKDISLHNVSFSGDYNDLSRDLPQTDDYINDQDRSNLLIQSSNLSEFVDLDEVSSNLELGDLAFEPLNDGYVVINNISFSDLEMFNNRNSSNNIGNILTNVEVTERIIRDQEFNNTSEWTNIFVDENNDIKDIYTLSPFFIEQSFTRSVQCVALSNMYSEIQNDLGNAQLNVFPENLEMDLLDLIENDHFLYTSSNLGDHGLDQIKSRSNIGLGNISTLNSNEDITFKKLEINQIWSSDYLITNSNIDYILISSNYINNSSNNDHGVLDILDIEKATNSKYGFVKYESNNDYSNNDVFTWDKLRNTYNQLLSRINETNNSILTDYNEYTNNSNIIFLDYDLSFYNLGNNSQNVNIARSNLEINEISRSGNYHDLVTKPNNLDAFVNDIELSKRSDNCSKMLNIIECQNNLGLGDLCRQNKNNINLNGRNLYLDNVQTNKLNLFDSSSNNQFNYTGQWITSKNSIGEFEYRDLPIAKTDTFGIVKLSSNFLDVAPDKVIEISKLQELNDLLNTKINELIKLYNEHINDM